MKNIRMFQDTDFDTLKRWVDCRGKFTITKQFVPKVGMIIEDTACGFLQFTDTNVFLLEVFATNPEANLLQRGRAIIKIAASLVKLAIADGRTRCLILTREDKILSILTRCGFEIEKMNVAYKNI